jgi:hypothetical protein
MFRALLVHPLEAVHNRHLVYCVGIVWVGCYQDWSGTGVGDTKIPSVVCAAPPEDKQVMLETCRDS